MSDKSARDRRRRHYKHIGRRPFFHQLFALQHAETVLFIDDHQAQPRKFHLWLKQRMRPHDELRFAGPHAFERGFFLRCLHSADQQLDAVSRAGEYFSRGKKMLYGENFGGRHERRLETVFDDDGRGFQRDDSFAAAHVALQQAIHGHAALQIRGDFPKRSLLRVGGLERQDALDRFANGRLAHTKRDPRLLLGRFLSHGHT